MVHVVAVVRKVVPSKTHFITLTERLIPPSWSVFDVTVVPLNGRWGSRRATFIKRRGRSRLNNSVKLTIPRRIARELGLESGGYVWVRLLPHDPERGEAPLPPSPFIAAQRSLHTINGSLYIVVSRNYLDRMASTIEWSGRVYVALNSPHGVLRTVTEPRAYGSHGMYYIPLPAAWKKLLGEERRVYAVLAPLPRGLDKRLYSGNIPGLPL